MPEFFFYIREFYLKEFKWLYFFLISLMVGLLVYLNYWHSLEIININGNHTWWKPFAEHYLLYFTPFALAFFLQFFFFTNCNYYKNKWFWIILFLAPAFFSFRVNFNFWEILIRKICSGDKLRFWLSCFTWLVKSFIVSIFIFFIWRIKDKTIQPFYGFKKADSIKPYFVMLLMMLPLIALASAQKDFLEIYPKAKFISELKLPLKYLYYCFYELCYGFDIINIEIFFRGFLILSLVNICGTHCIIPIACFYCTIHFGKPMGEAISSFWGGLLLGIICFNTRSIWGVILLHVGIAWLNEISGWTVLLLKK